MLCVCIYGRCSNDTQTSRSHWPKMIPYRVDECIFCMVIYMVRYHRGWASPLIFASSLLKGMIKWRLRWCVMVHSDFIALHWSTSAGASLSQQLCALQIFVLLMRIAMQKASIGRRRSMQNDGSLHERTMSKKRHDWNTCVYVDMCYDNTFIFKVGSSLVTLFRLIFHAGGKEKQVSKLELSLLLWKLIMHFQVDFIALWKCDKLMHLYCILTRIKVTHMKYITVFHL